MKIVMILLAATTLVPSTRATESDIAVEVVRQISIAAMGKPTGKVNRLVLLDITSFQNAFRNALKEDVSETVLLHSTGRPNTKKSTAQEAMICPRDCQIVDDGTFIRLDSLEPHYDRLVAVVTVMQTDRRGFGRTNIGSFVLRLEFTRSENSVKLANKSFLRRS